MHSARVPQKCKKATSQETGVVSFRSLVLCQNFNFGNLQGTKGDCIKHEKWHFHIKTLLPKLWDSLWWWFLSSNPSIMTLFLCFWDPFFSCNCNLVQTHSGWHILSITCREGSKYNQIDVKSIAHSLPQKIVTVRQTRNKYMAELFILFVFTSSSWFGFALFFMLYKVLDQLFGSGIELELDDDDDESNENEQDSTEFDSISWVLGTLLTKLLWSSSLVLSKDFWLSKEEPCFDPYESWHRPFPSRIRLD